MVHITCFGEVLWDIFPTHKKIGGAPLNVALRLHSLENNVAMITRIGDDPEGKELVAFIKKQGLNIDNIQIDKKLITGATTVALDQIGTASYDIKFPTAWDAIQSTDSARQAVATTDAFIFGSLVARNDSSRATLQELLQLAKYKIFDVNLRAPHYTAAVLTHLMKAADFIKFNDDELFEIAKPIASKKATIEEHILWIAKQTNTPSICVTRGSDGAVLYYKERFYYNTGYQVDVIDTVGAGDSFLASLIHKLLQGTAPQIAINFACAVGALVAGSEGANPNIKEETIHKLINAYSS